VAIAVYLLLLRRKRKGALRYANLALMKDAMGAGSRVRGTCRRSCS